MGMFKESCYNTITDRYVMGVSEEGSRELTLFVGSSSKMYGLMKEGKKYYIYNHILRFKDNRREPYNFMYFCLWHINLKDYDTVNIIIEERELGGNRMANRQMRLSEIEKDLMKIGRTLNGAEEHIEWLQETYHMEYKIALNTFMAMCDWSKPSFNVIIEWTEVKPIEEVVEEQSLIKKVIGKIIGRR